jgi:hypothetical protein
VHHDDLAKLTDEQLIARARERRALRDAAREEMRAAQRAADAAALDYEGLCHELERREKTAPWDQKTRLQRPGP